MVTIMTTRGLSSFLEYSVPYLRQQERYFKRFVTPNGISMPGTERFSPPQPRSDLNPPCSLTHPAIYNLKSGARNLFSMVGHSVPRFMVLPQAKLPQAVMRQNKPCGGWNISSAEIRPEDNLLLSKRKHQLHQRIAHMHIFNRNAEGVLIHFRIGKIPKPAHAVFTEQQRC